MSTIVTIKAAVLAVLMLTAPVFAQEGDEAAFQVLRGYTHVHSNHSHDSSATLRDILQAARDDKIDFVLVTDHNSLSAAEEYRDMKETPPPFMIFANEISAKDGHVIALGVAELPPENLESQALVDWIHARGGYAILAHPMSAKEPWANWQVRNWDGFELYNFASEIFEGSIVDFGIRLYTESEEEVLAPMQNVKPEEFEFFDRHAAERRVAMVGGTNAHLKRSDKTFRVALHSVTQYVLVPSASEAEIVKALGEGRSFIAFGPDASGFGFWAESGGRRYEMGGSVPLAADAAVHVRLQEEAVILVKSGGKTLHEAAAKELEFPVTGAGAFRVEILRGDKLWIVSNPLYFKEAAAEQQVSSVLSS